MHLRMLANDTVIKITVFSLAMGFKETITWSTRKSCFMLSPFQLGSFSEALGL